VSYKRRGAFVYRVRNTPDTRSSHMANTQVTAWLEVNVRAEPNTTSEIISVVKPNESYEAICWTNGEVVTMEGHTSSIWVQLDRTWPRANGYVTAIALTGDERGGVPEGNRC
jgi:uncharacterized protein YgiM (DUF1202 family)